MVAKVLLCGLPGAGKTTLARAVDRRLHDAGIKSQVVDGDVLVECQHLGLDPNDEGLINQAHQMGKLADWLTAKGTTALCSFVCPLPQTRIAFWGTRPSDGTQQILVYVNRIDKSRFPDIDRVFLPPVEIDVTITPYMTVEESVELVFHRILRKSA